MGHVYVECSRTCSSRYTRDTHVKSDHLDELGTDDMFHIAAHETSLFPHSFQYLEMASTGQSQSNWHTRSKSSRPQKLQ